LNTHTRNIRSGDQYVELIPKPSNRKVVFGFGDTRFSLENMKMMILETLSETKQLANQLVGQTVEQSVNNVKEFLYWHVQYLQDGLEQQLHSPAHTWSVKSTGVDCKSYSLFASSLLTNMGIANSLRQIKQLTYNPEFWSHVYVVVPGTELVVDGTVIYDYEPRYAEKNDLEILADGLKGLGQLNQYCKWDCSTTKSNDNNQESNIEISTNEKIKTKGGARLPFASLKEILADTDLKQSTELEQTTSGEPVLSIGDQTANQTVSQTANFRLRLAKAKAKARKRKIKLLKSFL